MLFLLGLIVRALARLLRIGGRDKGAKEDLEILVLRHLRFLIREPAQRR